MMQAVSDAQGAAGAFPVTPLDGAGRVEDPSAGAQRERPPLPPTLLDIPMRIEADLLTAYYRMLPYGVLAMLLGALVLAAALLDERPGVVLMVWGGLLLAASGWNVWLASRFPPPLRTDPQVQRWGRAAATGAFALGVAWGLAGLLLYVPDSVGRQVLLLASLSVAAGGAVFLSGRHLPALYAFVLPALLPVSLRLISELQPVHVFAGGMSLLFIAGVRLFGRDYNLALRDAERHRLENDELVELLREQKAAVANARQEAVQINLSKTRFLAAASHDLRQPLHALGLFAAALKERINYPEVRAIVDNICASVESLDSQFSALLDISKLDAGAVKPKNVDFSLRDMFERIRRDYGTQAHEKMLDFRILPGTPVVRSDPILVERILRNLVSNAIRYTEKGGVLVGYRKRGGMLSMEVWDTGIGIDADQRDKIWEEFYQIGNPGRDRQKGLGLGLATVRRLSELLGSTVDLYSRLGRGSVFKFTVPLGYLAPAEPVPPAVFAPVDPEHPLKGKLILAIDDEIGVQEAMRALMSQWECDVLVAGSVDEALDKLPEYLRYPDLMLVDYRLREGLNGIEAVRRVRYELGMDIPALLVSGTTTQDSLTHIRASGLPLLNKPVSATLLRQKVNEILHG